MRLLELKFFDIGCLLGIASCFYEANFSIKASVRVKA